MRVLLCPHCLDVAKLGKHRNFCKCLRTYGRFAENLVDMLVSQDAIVMDLCNREITRAIADTPYDGPSAFFSGKIVPHDAKVVIRKKYIEECED